MIVENRFSVDLDVYVYKSISDVFRSTIWQKQTIPVVENALRNSCILTWVVRLLNKLKTFKYSISFKIQRFQNNVDYTELSFTIHYRHTI